jgi:hypothetical protein
MKADTKAQLSWSISTHIDRAGYPCTSSLCLTQQCDKCAVPGAATFVLLLLLCGSEHYADELEMELADTLLEEFQVEVEDGSPAQVRCSSRCIAAVRGSCC